MEPGIYETGIVTSLLGCSWERLSGVSGTPEEVIAGNEVSNHDVVEIVGTDAAFDTNCEAWYTLTAVDPLMTTIPEGKWVLGTHIESGHLPGPRRQRLHLGAALRCLGNARRNRRHRPACGRGGGRDRSGDFAFNSVGCGEWAPA